MDTLTQPEELNTTSKTNISYKVHSGWSSNDIKDNDINTLHLIPKALSLHQTLRKIESGEDFCVYVVIPMWPEGELESTSVQAILDWQRRDYPLDVYPYHIVRALKEKHIVGTA
ncbi:phospholipase D alpha 1 [Tanacetum coccineum]